MKKQQAVKILRIVMPVLALLTIVVIAPLDVVPLWMAPLPGTVQEQVDAAVGLGLDGIIVYVDQAGEPPAFYAAGWKSKANQVPADPQALFKVASLNKLYVATAVAKLASRHVLSLDDTLADHLPELLGRVENADQITLRMMVQHRSGIPNFVDAPGFDWFTPQTDSNKNLELVLDKPADFKPGTDYGYSNTNYPLLGRILDKVLGYSHEQYIENAILTPLGLQHTYSFLSQAKYDDVASGYWYHYDDDLKDLDNSMVATAQDVGTFLRALNDGSLLNDDEQAIYSSIYEYGHTGWLPGYYSIARYHQDIDTVVVQFVNTTGGDTWGLSVITGGKALLVSDIVYGRIVKILRR